MSDFKDYYNILGLSINASSDDIKRAYRKLAKKYHPDTNKSATASEMFALVTEAYDNLSDDIKRRDYDLKKAKNDKTFENKTKYYEGGEFDGDFFGFDNELSSYFKRRGAGRNDDPDFGTLDLEETVIITPMESVNGCRKRITITDSFGKKEFLDINIPKGIANGERIRFKGRGISLNGKSGNLYVIVKIENINSDNFERVGNDIIMKVKVPFTTCALGGELKVKTLNGDVLINIKEGTQSGTKIRLKGKGVRDMKNPDIIGDEIIIVDIDVPKDLSVMAKRKLNELKDLL